MTIVKICGLRRIEHALAAVEAGANLLGFIFAPSRRQVRPADVTLIAEAIIAGAPAGKRPGLVGVFVDETPDQMETVARACHLDALQLSGDEDVRVLDVLPSDRALIKAVRLNGALAEQRWLDAECSSRLRLLVDAHVAGSYGGAGVLADWDQAAQLARRHEIVLAGGLTPDNVAVAIRRVRPWGVDVSSGVETDGVKDVAKIRAFIAAVRAVDQE